MVSVLSRPVIIMAASPIQVADCTMEKKAKEQESQASCSIQGSKYSVCFSCSSRFTTVFLIVSLWCRCAMCQKMKILIENNVSCSISSFLLQRTKLRADKVKVRIKSAIAKEIT